MRSFSFLWKSTLLQRDHKHFICRIKANTDKTCLEAYSVGSESLVFYDAMGIVRLVGEKQTKKPLRLVGYTVDGTKYEVVTRRIELIRVECVSDLVVSPVG